MSTPLLILAAWVGLQAPPPLADGAPAPVDAARAAPGRIPAAVPFTADELVLGAVDAPVTVVEYLSDTCSHCAAFDRDVYPDIQSKLIATGRLRLVIRELPTAPVAVSAAGFLLARCAGAANYWPAVRALLSRQAYVTSAPTPQAGVARAEEVVGATPEPARLCLSDAVALDKLNDRRQAALDAGIESTPTFIFNGRQLAPGDVLGGSIYEGGELSPEEFSAAYRAAAGEKAATPARRPGLRRRRVRER